MTMTLTRHTQATSIDPATQAFGRYDLYAGIHKGIRLAMSQTLVQVGATDPKDRVAINDALTATRELLALCRLHLHDENTHVHPALERCEPGASERVAGEHVDHGADIAGLEAAIATVQACIDSPAAALRTLYLKLSRFVGHNFEHMVDEETRHNAVLWTHLTDQELADIEHAIIASIEPDMMNKVLAWMIPALDHPQRVAMFEDMRAGAPAEAFRQVLRMAEEKLPASEWRKLARALASPA